MQHLTIQSLVWVGEHDRVCQSCECMTMVDSSAHQVFGFHMPYQPYMLVYM